MACMTLLSDGRPGFDFTAADLAANEAQVQANALSGILRIARALAEQGRPVDLAGLDERIGRLCTFALNLPAEPGRALRPVLAHLLAELDGLAAALRP